MQQQPEKLTRTPLKEDIEHSFLETSKRATSLRNIIMCKCAGNKDSEFRMFVGQFNYLFDISSHKTTLSENIITKCETWFMRPKPKAEMRHIIEGLKLYNEYSKELFKQGVLVYG